mmetsp:Transcript_9407/g.17736  ORF Transcript_9407/g.17736 Transcript_9407/m.17736 type:complete len:244 (+) Transcript_9407:4145-4876(+)
MRKSSKRWMIRAVTYYDHKSVSRRTLYVRRPTAMPIAVFITVAAVEDLCRRLDRRTGRRSSSDSSRRYRLLLTRRDGLVSTSLADSLFSSLDDTSSLDESLEESSFEESTVCTLRPFRPWFSLSLAVSPPSLGELTLSTFAFRVNARAVRAEARVLRDDGLGAAERALGGGRDAVFDLPAGFLRVGLFLVSCSDSSSELCCLNFSFFLDPPQFKPSDTSASTIASGSFARTPSTPRNGLTRSP